jgi:hypothetical protein
VQTPPPPPFKCDVLRESLSVDSQNVPCATLKRRGSWVTSVYLWQYPKFDERFERLILSSDWRVRMQLRRGHRLHSLAGEVIDPPTLHKFENLR